MRRFADLHTHSTASDGTLSPRELVRVADRRRLAVLALTDHDTTEGVAAARDEAAGFPDLCFVPGIEISARFPSGTLHILGLGIDENSPVLTQATARLREARERRNPKIVAKLRQLGVEIDMADVLQVATAMGGGRPGVVGRLHIAETLRRQGRVNSTREAFERYIGAGKPAFVDKEPLSPRLAIASILGAGGAAVLAHPAQLHCQNRAQLDRLVREFTAAGLSGIEVYHTDHTTEQTRLYLDLARRHNLLIVGGSDCHGSAKPEARLGRPRVPVSLLADHPVGKRLLRTE